VLYVPPTQYRLYGRRQREVRSGFHCSRSVASGAPKSHDLNPVDYTRCGVRRRTVKLQGVDDLKQRLIDVWDNPDLGVIDLQIGHEKNQE